MLWRIREIIEGDVACRIEAKMPGVETASKLVFIHLSDIHFVKGISGETAWDVDAGLRHAIEQDVQRMLGRAGPVTGILISGDVAFAGKVGEYEIAKEWLRKIAGIVGCDPGLVWCVPGNHDIDQSVHKSVPTLLDTHAALRASNNLDRDLMTRMTSEESGTSLFQPLKNYHEQFGAFYGCPTTHGTPFWEDDLTLNDASIVRLRGINSAIISSALDDADKNRKLVVGGAQVSYRPEDGVVYLTLCHHPPSWLHDEDDVHSAMVAHSHLQLFGHKHAHRHEKINETLRLYSGAVHPVRAEKKWEPRYYFISLHVARVHKVRQLVVELFPRSWSAQSHTFGRDASAGESDSVIVQLALSEWAPAEKIPDSNTCETTEQRDTSVITTLDRKRLINRFMQLPYHSQLSILRRFDLFTEEERKTIPDTELFLSCFRRAREKHVLSDVWDAIEAESQKGSK